MSWPHRAGAARGGRGHICHAMLPDSSLGGALVFELGPSFATKDADRLHDAIARAGPAARVELDFRGVREWEAAALAVLARDLVERRDHLAVRGLSRRQLRLLGYLGVEG